MKAERENVSWNAFSVQVFAAITISLSACLTSFSTAWPSFTIANFLSNETVLSHPMSTGEISLLGSLSNVGALLSTPFWGYAIGSIGRKYTSILVGVPNVLTWLIISLTTSVPLVIAAMALSGIGMAGQCLSPVYIAEISQDSIRGGLISITGLGYLIGLLFAYTLGGILTYYQVIYTFLSLSVLYMVILITLKDSPIFLLQKNKVKEAERAIAFYRQVEITSKEVENELNKLKLQLDPRIDKILQGEKDLHVTKELLPLDSEAVVKSDSAWKFLMKSESSKRALITVLTLAALSIMMGGIILTVFAEPLFKEAVPSISSNRCSIFLALVFLSACIIFTFIVDRFGRKSLMIWTSVATGLCTVVLGAQLHLHFAPHWFTAFLIYLYSFVSHLGAAVIPFFLPAEVFLPEVRSLCNSIALMFMWIANFITLLIFNPLAEKFGLGPIFYGFAGICFLTALFSQLFLPETKGLSVDAIQLGFLKKSKIKKDSKGMCDKTKSLES